MSARRTTPGTEEHSWEFEARFREDAFGSKPQPAALSVKQAVTEIKKVAKRQPTLAAEGAVAFLARLSPALGRVDSPSAAIGTAVSNAFAELTPIIARAPVDATTRDAWLERLWDAYQQDGGRYSEALGDHWGQLCASKELASAWADRLIPELELAWSPDADGRGSFRAVTSCLSALVAAERYDEVLAVLELAPRKIWAERRYGVIALSAKGESAQAIRFAEESRAPDESPLSIARACEAVLLSSGLVDEAYARYGLKANQAGTYLATFRAVAKKYPHKTARDILADLVKTTPGDEGKWFAAAKDAGLFDDALALASTAPCDPRTLLRAARDYVEQQPAFAVGAGLLAIRWLVLGYGYEITSTDVWDAYHATLAAAEQHGSFAEAMERVRQLVEEDGTRGGIVHRVLARELGLR